MHPTNIRILSARAVQITCALFALGISIGLSATNAYGYDTPPVQLMVCAAMLASAQVLFGVFGLFGTKPDVEDDREIRLYFLLCFIDFWAILASLAAGTCLSVTAAIFGSDYVPSAGSTAVTGAVFAFLSGVPVVPLMIRTIRLYTVSVNYWVSDKNFDPSYDTATIEHRLQALESNYGGAKTAIASQHPGETDDIKSIHSTGPQSTTAETVAHWTTVSGAATLSILPNMDGVTHLRIGPPTEASSEIAPSYASRVR